MKKLLKILLSAVSALILLIAIVIVVVTSVIDPNDYKSDIEKAASDAGYPIAIQGELSWQWFPSIGISIGRTELLPNNVDGQSFAAIEDAAVSVSLLPLLRKEIVIQTISVTGLKTHLEIDEQGKGNWEVLLDKSSETQAATQNQTSGDNNGESSALSITADSIRIQNAAVTFIDRQNDINASLLDFDLTVDDLSLTGKSFPVEAQWQVSLLSKDLPDQLNVAGSFSSKIKLGEDFTSVEMNSGKLALLLENTAKSISESIVSTFTVAATDLKAQPNLNAQFKIDSFNPKTLMKTLGLDELATQNPQALTKVAASLSISGNEKQLSLSQLNLELDKTNITGTAQVNNLNDLNLQLRGTKINLDDYLPPESAATSATATTSTAAAGSPSTTTDSDEPLDLAFLDQYLLNADIAFEEITASGITFNKPTVKLNSGNGIAKLNELSLVLDGSKIVITGDVNKQQQFNAHLTVPTINPSKILAQAKIDKPEMADAKALTSASFELIAGGKLDAIQISKLQAKLDETTLNATGKINNFNSLDLALKGNSIDLDRYLPPPTEEPATANASTNTATAPEEPIPFELLKEFNANITVDFDRIKVTDMVFDNLNLALNNQNGLANLKNFSANFYEGTLKANGTIDARPATPKIAINGSGNGVSLEPLLTSFIEPGSAQSFLFKGKANTQFTSTTNGLTSTQLFENLNAQLSADTQSLQLVPVNIEKMVCQAIALVQGESFNSQLEWPDFTQMQQFNAKINFANQIATIENLSAGVQQFKIGANGKVDLGKQSLDVQLPFSVTHANLERQGCPVTSSYLVGRAMSLIRCKGDLSNPTSACGLDERAIREWAKDYLEDKAKQKAKDKLKIDEKRDDLRDKIDDKLGDGASKLLDGLFKRDKDK
ncbi:hypothetical protein MAH1_22750 [Sessilibacter sp. MAH1]